MSFTAGCTKNWQQINLCSEGSDKSAKKWAHSPNSKYSNKSRCRRPRQPSEDISECVYRSNVQHTEVISVEKRDCKFWLAWDFKAISKANSSDDVTTDYTMWLSQNVTRMSWNEDVLVPVEMIPTFLGLMLFCFALVLVAHGTLVHLVGLNAKLAAEALCVICRWPDKSMEKIFKIKRKWSAS